MTGADLRYVIDTLRAELEPALCELVREEVANQLNRLRRELPDLAGAEVQRAVQKHVARYLTVKVDVRAPKPRKRR